MIKCKKCNADFEEGSTVYECDSCGDIFCENCQEEHSCADSEAYDNESCSNCSNCDETMQECMECNEKFCEGCIKGHLEDHKPEFTEHDYEEYVTEKVADEL